MSRRPFFSVAIPSKNRADRLRQSVRSVLEQTWTDLEVIICDNSDDAEAAGTAAVARQFDDPRVTYVRTSGQLSMPDNWERAIAGARGEYVGILTDRSVYYPHTLERVKAEIDRTGTLAVGWFPDHFGRDSAGRAYRRRNVSGESWHVESRRLIDYFLHGHPKHAPKLLPKLMSAMCSRRVIDEVKSSPVGRICPVVCPDYTSGYLILAHTERIILLDDAMFVSCGSGNGSAFRRRGPLAERFRRDLGMTWKDLVDRMPTDACFTTALVLNDLMRLRDALPERFAHCDVDRVQYYLGCLHDYTRAARQGGDLTEDYDALIEGLNREPESVQRQVRSRHIYLQSIAIIPRDGEARQTEMDQDDDDEDGLPTFDSVFDAMQWAATNPRPPRGVVSTTDGPIPMPRIDELKPAAIGRKNRPLVKKRRGALAEVS